MSEKSFQALGETVQVQDLVDKETKTVCSKILQKVKGNTFVFTKAVLDMVLDTIISTYRDKPLIFVGAKFQGTPPNTIRESEMWFFSYLLHRSY